jgi:DNA-binding response OmpR family regulator
MTSSNSQTHVPTAIVVDGDEKWRTGIRPALAGFLKALEAESPAAAFELLDSHEFDLAVVDVQCPGIGDTGLAELLAEHRPGIALIVTSNEALVDDRRVPDCAALMMKPFSMNELMDAMMAAFANREAKFQTQEAAAI